MANFCSKCGKPVVAEASFCVNCGSSLNGKRPARADWQAKREKVVGGGSRKNGKLKKYGFLAAALALVAFIFISNLPKSGSPVINAQPAVTEKPSYAGATTRMTAVPSTVDGKDIVVSLDLVREKKLVTFTYQRPDGQIPLLAYVSEEGKVVTAVSMCEPCKSQRFHISGDRIICDACGTTWKLDTLEPVSGGCAKYPPDAIPNMVTGGKIRIDAQTVADWRPRV